MKILETLASADPTSGGPLVGVIEHAEIWARQGHVCELVTLDPPNAPFLKDIPIKVHALGEEPTLPAKVHRLIPPLRYGYTAKYVPWLKQNVERYDAVIVNGLWNYSVFGAREALSRAKVPYFVFSHGMLDPWFAKVNPAKNAAKQAFWLFNEGPLVNGARALLFTTDEERILARNAFWPYRVRERIVGYGTSDAPADDGRQIAAFHAKVPSVKGRPYLLFLSRIHPKKGCDLLISAFAAVAEAHPNLDLVLAGPDQLNWRPQLEKMAEQAGIERRIHWPGMLSGDAKWGAFRACEAFVLPSHQENFGVAVVEALACEKPVLISNKVNIWREIADAKAGLVADDTQADTTKLLRDFLQLDDMTKRTMGASARRLFLEKFHVEQAANTLLQAMKEECESHVHS